MEHGKKNISGIAILTRTLYLLILLLAWNNTYATNTYSADVERSSSQYLYVNSDLGASFSGSLTIECWIRPEIQDGYNKQACQLEDAETDVRYLIYHDDGFVNFKREKIGDSAVTIQWANNPAANTWLHVVGTYDGTSLRLYSASAGGTHTLRAGPTTSTGSGVSGGTDSFKIGYGNADYTYYDGMIDDVRVWSTARSISDLDTYFETELCGTETNLLGYWKLNNTLDDEVGTNDLTNSGSVVFSATVPFSSSSSCGGGGGGSSGSSWVWPSGTATTSSTTTEAILINGFLAIVFGLAILIFLVMLFVSGYLYNNIIKPIYDR